MNSLEEFKRAIFENTVASSQIGAEPNAVAKLERRAKQAVAFAKSNPLVTKYVGEIPPVWFLLIRKQIICIDDMERRGKGLEIRDLLGLVSNLIEQRGCKVALILNDEELEDRAAFDKYIEKVVDTFVKFEPSAADSAKIALGSDTKTDKLLGESCIGFGISNIRVIRKIQRSVNDVADLLKDFDERVLQQAVQSLALLGWSVHEPTRAPSVDYLKRKRAFVFGPASKAPVPDNEAAWNALLDANHITHLDEFDLALLDGIRKGYFDPASIKELASKLDEGIKAARLDGSFEDAWRPYHDSFADNEAEVVNGILDSFSKNVLRISAVNLSGTVSLLKDLGRPAQGEEALKLYLDSPGATRKRFDLANYPFPGSVKDPDVIAAFNQRFASLKPEQRNPKEILRSIGKSNGWSEDDIETLSELPVEGYRQIFKSESGESLRELIRTCLQFRRITGASDRAQEIARRAEQALALIGRESRLNALRVQKYGVTVEAVGEADKTNPSPPNSGAQSAADRDPPLEARLAACAAHGVSHGTHRRPSDCPDTRQHIAPRPELQRYPSAEPCFRGATSVSALRPQD